MWPVLIPYFVLLVAYILLTRNDGHDIDGERKSVCCTFCKVLPTLYLTILLVLAGSIDEGHTRQRGFITAGILTTSISDVIIEWPQTRWLAYLLSASVKIMYVMAFGFRVVSYQLGLLCAVSLLTVLLILSPAIKTQRTRLAMMSYGVVLSVLAWRSLTSYVHGHRDVAQLWGCIGVILMIVVDFMSAVQMWMYKSRIITYVIISMNYLAQLSMALTVLMQSWHLMKSGTLI